MVNKCSDFMYQQLVRPCLFRFQPEPAHQYSLQALQLATCLRLPLALLRSICKPPSGQEVALWDLRFPNPVGLAAGMDKDGEVIEAMFAMGFGSLELGTVTPNPQPGNPKPRLFRYPDHHAIVNRMGFNNAGVTALVERVQRYRAKCPQATGVIGINIGKQKETPIEGATADYLYGFNAVADVADYIAVNISSPNTQNLRKLQEREHLEDLLGSITARNRERVAGGKRMVPTLLKIAPDLEEAQLESIVELVLQHQWQGIIATNTTVDRSGANAGFESPGGLSGAPVRERSTRVIQKVHQLTGGKLPIIGVGGIETAAHAREKLDAGAALVQVYSGFIYQGPRMVQRMVSGLPTA
jgi:dihydroorotate dehydrogenase